MKTNESPTIYEFWTLDGRHLENAATDDPSTYASELAHFHGVDADEVEWVEYDPTEWE